MENKKTVREFALEVGKTEHTVHRWIKTGKIKAELEADGFKKKYLIDDAELLKIGIKKGQSLKIKPAL